MKTVSDVQKEYYRQWREKNKDKIAAKNKRYWEKKAREANKKEAGE